MTVQIAVFVTRVQSDELSPEGDSWQLLRAATTLGRRVTRTTSSYHFYIFFYIILNTVSSRNTGFKLNQNFEEALKLGINYKWIVLANELFQTIVERNFHTILKKLCRYSDQRSTNSNIMNISSKLNKTKHVF